MSEHAFCDFTRANYPHEEGKNGIGVALVHGAIHAWERRHKAKVSEYAMIARPDLGEAIVELQFSKVEYLT